MKPLSQTNHSVAIPSGAAMDQIVPINRKRRLLKLAFGALILFLVLILGWASLPKGLQVSVADIRIQAAEPGIFLDDIIVRANAQPLNSVILDSVEYGRVEEIYVQDGAMLKQGQLLFRLSNSQRNLDLLQRKGEHTQQVANMANMQVMFQSASADAKRRLAQLAFDLEQAKKRHERNRRLAQEGFISQVALEESTDQYERASFVYQEEVQHQKQNATTRQTALAQMEAGINGLQSGLALVTRAVDGLAVRAPIMGKLTDFHLQVGESVTTGKRLGRVDDPTSFKLQAYVDEYYLNRVTLAQQGKAQLVEQSYDIKVMAIYPQIKEGRFLVELSFIGQNPQQLHPGQSLDVNITLGAPKPASQSKLVQLFTKKRK
ncbi:MAG: HlyD family efflux transporter periplasmic adaptor subunit [Burkholderiales bacterium]|nr:HlyD family efflux transporter periplasmic adaptor subunit [Burkholderiales bacterium]